MRVGTTNKFDLQPLFTALEKLQAFELGKAAGRNEKKTGTRVSESSDAEKNGQ
jgi:hypothetical protein